MSEILFTMACALLSTQHPACPPELVERPVNSLPILTVAYDPLHINLDPSGCNMVMGEYDCGYFANMEIVTPERYGNTAACIPQWINSTVTIPGVGEWKCRDTGSLVQISWNKYYEQWVVYLDVMHDLEYDPDPWFNYHLWSNWSVEYKGE